MGERSSAFHAEIGFYARDRGIDRLLAVGVASIEAARAFGDQGQHFENPDSLLEATCAIANKDTAVLVKGSRFMRMESIVERLVNAT